MKKIISTTLALAVLTVTLFGCGSNGASGTVGPFEAETLAGGTFSQEDLKKYDITMVNVWGTFCDPCLSEMPKLQEMYSTLPENVNMVLVCSDWESNEETAMKIVEDLGLTMPNLKANDQLNSGMLKGVKALPTTFFLDKDGNKVGKSAVGAPDEDKIIEHYTERLNKALEAVSK